MTIRKEACLIFSGFQETGGKQDKEESGVCMGIGVPAGLRPQTRKRKAEGSCAVGWTGPKNPWALFSLQTKSVVFRRQRRAFLSDSDSPQRFPALKGSLWRCHKEHPIRVSATLKMNLPPLYSGYFLVNGGLPLWPRVVAQSPWRWKLLIVSVLPSPPHS